MMRVLVVAGGSGGHIFPAIGFCRELAGRLGDNVETTFVATIEKTAAVFGPLYHQLTASGVRPVFLEINKSPLGLIRLFWRSFCLMAALRPRVVFGFGGYMSVPFVVLAKVSGRQAFIHEQNVYLGQANKFLSRWVDRVAISFPQTARYFGSRPEKIFLARWPLRKACGPPQNVEACGPPQNVEACGPVDKSEALKFFELGQDLLTILVVGGSQGAHRLNLAFLEALEAGAGSGRFQVIHLSGGTDMARVAAGYRRLSIRSKVFAFLEQMDYAYCAADIVVSRAGAGVIFEIMSFGLPSILVPYPYAGGHQIANAGVLAARGAAVLIEEKELPEGKLRKSLESLMLDEARRKRMSGAVSSFYSGFKASSLTNLIVN